MTDKEKLTRAIELLQWFIDNDETNSGDEPMPEYGGRTWDEMNAYWLHHLNEAKKFVEENK